MTLRYVSRRLVQVPVAATGILLAGFLLIHLTPGDPVVALAGEHGDAAYYAFMREKFGLDRPASLGFLGLSDPNAISWGYLANQAQRFLRIAWWMWLFPGVAIMIAVLALNLLGDALTRDTSGRA